MKIRFLSVLSVLAVLALWLCPAGIADSIVDPPGSAQVPASTPVSVNWQAAEQFRLEQSFGLALDLYRKVDRSRLDEGGNRWLDFRLADCAWRSQAATSNPDNTELQTALAAVQVFVEGVDRKSQQDQVWAEARDHW